MGEMDMIDLNRFAPPGSEAAAMTAIAPVEAAGTPLNRSDAIGIGLSVLCAIHCAATPVLIAMLPTLGLSAFEQPWVHQAMFVGCLLLAGNAVMRGFRVHGRRWVPGLAAGGLGLLAASAFVWPAPCCAKGTCVDVTCADDTCTDGSCETGLAATRKAAVGIGGSGGSGGSGGTDCSHCCHHDRTSGDRTTGGRAAANVVPDSPTNSLNLLAQKTAVSPVGAAADEPARAGFLSASISNLWLSLMTPLGGILLIVAHVLNIRWTRHCSCGCCEA